jgi:DDE superfamily endonuclease
VFVDRLLATLVHLRHGVTHDVLACWFGVSRSTITRAVGEVRPLLAERGCTVENGVRLHTWPTWSPTRGASRQLGLLDATAVHVRRPAAGRAGRQRFVSGTARANTVKGAGDHRRRRAAAVLRPDPPGLRPRPDAGSPGGLIEGP